MQDPDPEALETAVCELEELAEPPEEKKRPAGRPDRYDARALLVALGQVLRAEAEGAVPAGAGCDPPRAAHYLQRLSTVLPRLAPQWEEACQSELSLACAEHIHGVDPRYLDLPNYDFEYTRRARGLLEDRLVAARELGLSPPEALLEGIRRADARLRAHYQQ